MAATRSSWYDYLYVSGVSYVQLSFAVDGTIARQTVGPRNSPIAEFDVGRYLDPPDAYPNLIDLTRSYTNSAAQYGRAPHVQGYADRFTYLLPTYGSNQVAFQFELRTFVFAGDAGEPASLDFTGGVTGVQFFDGNMQALGDVPYRWELGTQFYVPVSAVPEPSTWAMLGVGVLVLGAVRTRRNRRGSLTS